MALRGSPGSVDEEPALPGDDGLMPRLWILSDLHEEEASDENRSFGRPEFDILVVAGDVCEADPRGCVEAVARIAGGRPAVMTLGNHDLYGLPVDRAALVARRIGADLGVHVLERSAAEVAGLRFAGGTLWESIPTKAELRVKPDLTDIMTGSAPAFFAPMPTAPYGEPVQVEDANGIRPATFADIHARRMHTLAAIAAAEADVVVTHYPPTREDLAQASGAGTWIHGHQHTFRRETVHGIDVIVNAVPSRQFVDRLVVEIDPRPRHAPIPGR
jgi:predicted MPP superfamily phosphohydrolase